MATPDLSIEEQAAYRPDISTNILNILTGGLYGGVTGQARRQAESSRARRLLQQEDLQKRAEERDIERQMQRRMLEQLLTVGEAPPEGETVADRVADYRRKMAKSAIMQEAGARAGYGFADIPTAAQQESLPYQRAASAAQAERYKSRSEAEEQDAINRPRLIQAAKAYNIPIDPSMPTAGIEALVKEYISGIPQEKALKEKFEANKADILSAQSEPDAPTFLKPFNVETSSRAQVAAMADKLDRYRKEQRETAAEKNRKAFVDYENNLEKEIAAAKEAGDQEKVESLVYRGPYPQIRDNPFWLNKVSARVAVPPDKRKELDQLVPQMSARIQLIRDISALSKEKNINDISKMSFNAIKSNLDNLGSKFVGNNEARNMLQRIKQEFEEIVSKDRNTLFGASLTDRELASAKAMFGDTSSADFLPRAIAFMDKVFLMRPSEKYPTYFVDIYDTKTEPLRNTYITERNKLNWAPFRELVPSNQPVSVLPGGPTAAPAASATNRIRINISGNEIK